MDLLLFTSELSQCLKTHSSHVEMLQTDLRDQYQGRSEHDPDPSFASAVTQV